MSIVRIWAVVVVVLCLSRLVQAQGPTGQPTASPVASPTGEPSPSPTLSPSPSPTVQPSPTPSPSPTVQLREINPKALPGGPPLTDADMRMAKAAWAYFTRWRHPRTGLVRASEGYAYTTMWDVASQINASMAARELGLISRANFIIQTKQLLGTLARLPLYKGELPTREYTVDTAQMIDFNGNVSSFGTGWSCLDVARLMCSLRLLADNYPELEQAATAVVKRWKMTRMVKNRELFGTWATRAKENYWQEGRLGYEHYAATALLLWGYNLPLSLDYKSCQHVKILDVVYPIDKRHSAWLTSEPFILMGLEMGFHENTFEWAASQIYEVQKARYNRTGILTAVTEDALDRPPYFVYYNIYLYGVPWNCVDMKGKPFPSARNVSSKASIGYYALYPDDYSMLLRKKMDRLVVDGRGVHPGIYENGSVNTNFNINTSGIILEALGYIHRGRRPWLSEANQQLLRSALSK